MSTRSLHRFANALADEARRIVRSRLRRQRSVRRKADRSPVTDIDLAVERRLRARIQRRFPEHGIVGEEFPGYRADAPFQWILDPIDGTRSLTHGLPFFGTIIGIHHRGRPVAGVIDFPMLRDRYHAARGLGAWRNRRRLRIRDVPASQLSDEIISAADRSRFADFGSAGAFDRLLRSHRHVRGYYDCIGHAYAAEGVIGAVVDFGVKPWDIAATRLLVEEAGGRFVIARQRGAGAAIEYGIIAGKPTVVRWLQRQFGVKKAT
jgi:histidinol phosphatase-like enzyme (inositol monophosphatase family)